MDETPNPLSQPVLPGPSEPVEKQEPKPRIYVPDTLPEGTENPRKAYLERKARIKKERQDRIVMMTERRNLKIKQRALVREKVEAGLPISAEERELLTWTASKKRKDKEAEILKQASALTIKPQNIEALRLVVEKTAAKHSYNPVEELIKLSVQGDLDDKDKVAIHKALMPFLVPTLPVPKERPADNPDSGIRVVVAQFTIPDHQRVKPEKPIFEDKPPVITEQAES